MATKKVVTKRKLAASGNPQFDLATRYIDRKAPIEQVMADVWSAALDALQVAAYAQAIAEAKRQLEADRAALDANAELSRAQDSVRVRSALQAYLRDLNDGITAAIAEATERAELSESRRPAR